MFRLYDGDGLLAEGVALRGDFVVMTATRQSSVVSLCEMSIAIWLDIRENVQTVDSSRTVFVSATVQIKTNAHANLPSTLISFHVRLACVL